MGDYSNDLVVLVIGIVLVGSMFVGQGDWVGDLQMLGVGGLIGHLSAKGVAVGKSIK